MKQPVEHTFPAQSPQNWTTAATGELEKGSKLDDLRVRKEGLEWNPYYTAADGSGWLAAKLPVSSAEFAGARHWINMPKILVDDVAQANAIALEHLQNGADGICFQLPIGFTSVEKLLDQVELPYCSINFLVNHPSAHFLNSFFAMAREKFGDRSISGNFFWMTNSNFLDVPKWKNLPGFKMAGIVVSQADNAAYQLAEALNEAVHRIERLMAHGLTTQQATAQISFSIELGNDFFLEAVKLRVLRALWNSILTAYEVKNLDALFIHAVSSSHVSAAFQPHGNLIKETYAAMAAVLGGCDGLTIEPEDPKNATMVRVARNTSSILREESFLSLVADPLAGSYLVEHLTKKLTGDTWQKFLLLTKK